MASFYESIKAFFSPDMAKRVSQVLNEDESNINQAASHIISGLLGLMSRQGNTAQIRNILKEAGNINLVENIGILNEDLTHPAQKIGDQFLNLLLGDKASAFTKAISKSSGISIVSANRLISIIAPSLPAFLGRILVRGGSFHGTIEKLKSEESTYFSDIPTELIQSFSLKPEQTEPPLVFFERKAVKKKNSWAQLFWLVAIILAIWAGWKSCSNHSSNKTNSDFSDFSIRPDSDPDPFAHNSDTMTAIFLPDGKEIHGYKNGTEERVVSFLSSEAYKNTDSKELDSIWFVLDNIAFEFGSTTELKESSMPQLGNIILILQAYKNTQIIVAAITNKTEKESITLKVSKERAKVLEEMLKETSIGSQIIENETYTYTPNLTIERNRKADFAIRIVR